MTKPDTPGGIDPKFDPGFGANVDPGVDPLSPGGSPRPDGAGTRFDPDPQLAGNPADGADFKALARDWITIWHSEMAAAATDREGVEHWQALVQQYAAAWAGAANAMTSAWPDPPPPPSAHTASAGRTHGGHDTRAARPAAPARAAPAAAAPDARDAEVERLARRVAELERRLAELDRGRD